MSYHVLGIAGPAHSGKDTLADYLIEKRPYLTKVSFADPMKRMLQVGLNLGDSQLYGDKKEHVDERYGCTPRHMMQTIGTEWGRKLINDNIWVYAMDKYLLNRSYSGQTHFVIPDVRFENEASFIRRHGTLIHITGRDQGVGKGHVSEAGVKQKTRDLFIENDGILEVFYERAEGLLLNCLQEV